MNKGKLGKQLKTGWLKAKKYLPDTSDIFIILGFVSVFYGLYCIYKPAAFVALGAGLIYWAIQLERGKPHG